MEMYDPRAEIVFRKIFGEHKHLCMSLLNSLLPLKEDELIVDLEYLPSDVFPLNADGKNSIVDVRCHDHKGRTFIVEMQMYWTEAFLMRALFNASKAFANQAEKGKKYKELQPVYSLCLLNENMLDTREYRDEYRHVYIIRHEDHSELTMEGMKFVFIELLKFHSLNRAHKKLTDLWLSFLTMFEDNKDNVIPAELSANKEVSEAVDFIKELKLSPEEKAHYDKFWDNVSCERTLLSERYEKGREEGREEGRMTEKIEIARSLKLHNVPIEIISQSSGLTSDEIEKL